MSGKEGVQEILIIRRGGGDDNAAHKGGAWKIAYADFVTAMMAFFLVMWLINSANEVTKARVASYFNPIKMTDASPARRGLKEEIDAQSPNNRAEEEGKAGGGQSKEKMEGKPPGDVTISEDKLLMNPYAMLDELVKQAEHTKTSGAAPVDNAVQGDPFNPRSFEHLSELQAVNVEENAPGKPSDVEGTTDNLASGDKTEDKADKIAKAGETSHSGVQPAPGEGVAKDAATGGTAAKPATLEHGPDAAEAKSGNAKTHTPEDKELAQKLRQEIEDQIAQFKGAIDLNARVTLTDEGLLIVLEDGQGRSMFSVGSAQPNPALIEIIGDIGKLLSKTEGNIVVRGHTDGRQFRNRKYDNWQLSTDRAHMASYMLIRGGLAEARIKRIEGYGSSTPVTPNELMLDANRRVEFLLSR